MNRRTARLQHHRRNLSKFSILYRLPTKRFLKIVVRFGVIIIAVYLFFSLPKLIVIQDIHCESQYGPCSAALLEKLSTARSKNYFSSKNTIKTLLEKEFFVQNYSIKLNLPSGLEIYAIERKAEVAFTREQKTDEFFIIDSQAIVISQQSKTSLPIIIIKSDYNFEVGKPLSNDLAFATAIMMELFKHHSTQLAFVSTGMLEAELTSGHIAIFPLDGDVDVLFGSLQLILSRLNTSEAQLRIDEGLSAKYIDLRFKNPVLR